LSVNVVELLAPTVWVPPGETCRADGLLEVPVIETLVLAVWLTLIVVDVFAPMITAILSVLIVQGTVGVGVAFGVDCGVGGGVGVGAGVGVGVAVADGVGVATGNPPRSMTGVGVGVEAVTSTGIGVGVADEVEPEVDPDVVPEPVEPADKSPTLRLTAGTESSNT
jgi:hypothetical protein